MASSAPKRHLKTSPFAERVVAPAEHYEIDDRVNHDVHGLGRVVSVDGEAQAQVTVRFSQGLVRVNNNRRLFKL
ncbi:hypothetical protein [uncultured Pseudokineococcus sp.]|uniref:hypothetical protein n=1 Tax=uncultured Pseudokineococcus sp. TaxID=1642928 RepID=UPI0026300506|nr:hypothetical protein [uncultured Pseudokineococcus sp.]